VLIKINGSEITATEAISDHINKTIEKALSLFERQVTRVEVHLHDSNAGKGGEDKRVVLEARLSGFQPLAVEHTAKDMYESITQAGHKLERAVKHKVERHHEHKASH